MPIINVSLKLIIIIKLTFQGQIKVLNYIYSTYSYVARLLECVKIHCETNTIAIQLVI